jgi:hypothetical protein
MKTAELVAALAFLGELHYLENKTRAYGEMLKGLIEMHQAL